jgi:HEPN domain-containing protein
MNVAASAWVGFAQEDLKMAELAYNEGIWNQTCFHAQQCVEKLLKAILAARGMQIPRVHRLVDLLGQVPPDVVAALTPHVANIRSLDRFYIPTRYPDALPGAQATALPTEPEANGALTVAKQAAALVLPLL